MPKRKHTRAIEVLKEADVFHISALEKAVGEGYARLLAHKLCESGKLTRLLPGWYTFKNTPYLAWIPLRGYVGLGHAAFYWGMWSQATVITFLTPRRVRTGERVIAGERVLVRRITPKLLFGLTYVELDGVRVRISDPEKTLVDLAYFNHPSLSEVLEEASSLVSIEKLRRYVRAALARGVYRRGKIRRLPKLLGKA